MIITYDNTSTSNNAKSNWRWDGEDSENTNPTEEDDPAGSLRAMDADYAAYGAAKNGNTPRPLKAKIAAAACWSSVLSSANINNVRNTLSSYADWSDYDNGNCLFFHNFDSSNISGTTVSPVYGGSDYDLTLTNGATTDSTTPW